MNRARWFLCAIVASAAPFASAQAPLYDLSGTTGDEFGRSVASLGDVDGDGFEDIAVGAPFGDGLQPDAGYVNVYSAKLGNWIYTLKGERTNDRFGWSLQAIGDLDGDGVNDFAVGAPFQATPPASQRGAVYVISGATGAQITKVASTTDGQWMGWSLASLGDVTGDAVPDYAVGRPAANFGNFTHCGMVTVHSGASHAVVGTFIGETTDDYFGWSLAQVGDLDGNGMSELVAGAPYYGSTAQPVGRAYLMKFPFPQPYVVLAQGALDGHLGFSVAGAFDADGDGLSEIALGEPFHVASGSPAGRIHVLSGASLAPLHVLDGTGDDQLGYSLAGLHDADGDGRGDLIAGLPGGDIGGFADYGLVQVFSGATWQMLDQQNGYHSDERMGHSVASAGLLNADPWTDWIAGANSSDLHGTDSGRARLVLGNAPHGVPYCVAKTNSAGCVPFISFAGCPSVSISNYFVVQGWNVLPGVSGNLIWSLAPNSAPFHGGTLCVHAPIRRTPLQLSTPAGSYACTGMYEFFFGHAFFAANGMSAGTEVYAQYWSRDSGFAAPNNIGLTNGLKFTVLP